MTPAQQQLRDALRDFMATAKSKDAAMIKRAMDRIAVCQQQSTGNLSPKLQHYLEQRSYQKALDWLESGAE